MLPTRSDPCDTPGPTSVGLFSCPNETHPVFSPRISGANMGVSAGSEIWKDIPGFEGLYQASNMGRIRSLPRRVPRNGGWLCIHERVLSPAINPSNGYESVRLSSEGKSRLCRVNVLVCEAFHGRRPIGKFAAHKNGNRTDNRSENLRWLTRKENESEKNDHGTRLYGEKSPVAKYSKAQVLEVFALRKKGWTYKSISDALNIHKSSVSSICLGYSWKRSQEAHCGS